LFTGADGEIAAGRVHERDIEPRRLADMTG